MFPFKVLSVSCSTLHMLLARSYRTTGRFCMMLAIILSVSQPISGQETKNKKEKKLPAPKSWTVKTKDGVSLACIYLAGTDGENTIPVILLHGFDGVGGEFTRLALFLQNEGHAVVVPDLRGHGESIRQHGRDGNTHTIDADKMRTNDFHGMYRYDLEAVKKNLLTEHNAGKLNIELLTLVGSEMGAIVAANWAVLDWSWPVLPSLKQGQDVQAMVLVSPKSAFKGIKLQPAFQHEDIRKLSTLIMTGADQRRSLSEAKRIHTKLKRFHTTNTRGGKRSSPRSLFLASFPTSLQGTKLLDAQVRDRKLNPHEWIARFIEIRVASQREEFPWKKRE